MTTVNYHALLQITAPLQQFDVLHDAICRGDPLVTQARDNAKPKISSMDSIGVDTWTLLGGKINGKTKDNLDFRTTPVTNVLTLVMTELAALVATAPPPVPSLNLGAVQPDAGMPTSRTIYSNRGGDQYMAAGASAPDRDDGTRKQPKPVHMDVDQDPNTALVPLAVTQEFNKFKVQSLKMLALNIGTPGKIMKYKITQNANGEISAMSCSCDPTETKADMGFVVITETLAGLFLEHGKSGSAWAQQYYNTAMDNQALQIPKHALSVQVEIISVLTKNCIFDHDLPAHMSNALTVGMQKAYDLFKAQEARVEKYRAATPVRNTDLTQVYEYAAYMQSMFQANQALAARNAELEGALNMILPPNIHGKF